MQTEWKIIPELLPSETILIFTFAFSESPFGLLAAQRLISKHGRGLRVTCAHSRLSLAESG